MRFDFLETDISMAELCARRTSKLKILIASLQAAGLGAFPLRCLGCWRFGV